MAFCEKISVPEQQSRDELTELAECTDTGIITKYHDSLVDTASTIWALLDNADQVDVNKEDAMKRTGEIIGYIHTVDGSLNDAIASLLDRLLGDDVESTSITGSSVKDSPENQVVIVNKGFSYSKDDYYGYLSVGAEIKNPNIDKCAADVLVKILVKDASGRILASNEDTIEYIDSNATFCYGTEIRIDSGVPANYQITVNCDNFVPAPANSTFSLGIKCSHYNLEKSRWGNSVTFSGNVTNTYGKRIRATLFFTFYNSKKEIVGGTSVYYVNLYANSEDTFTSTLNTIVDRSSVKFSPSFDFSDL